MSDDTFNKIMIILSLSLLVLVTLSFIIVTLFEEYEYCNCIKRCETCGKVVNND